MPTFLPPFSINQPATIDEACQLLRDYGDEGRAYAGGTELLLAIKQGGLRYDHLVDLKTIPGLNGISAEDGAVEIGALATHLAIERSPLVAERLPLMRSMEQRVANVRVRASGTLGGNLCFGEPHSDPATLLLCLDAMVRLTGPHGQRNLSLDELIVGPYETALGEGELLTSVSVPFFRASQLGSYQKFQVHEYPMLGLALIVELDEADSAVTDARLAVGSVSPRPIRSTTAGTTLLGDIRGMSDKLDAAADILADEAELQDDLEGSADYKRHLIHVFLRRAHDEIVSRSNASSAGGHA